MCGLSDRGGHRPQMETIHRDDGISAGSILAAVAGDDNRRHTVLFIQGPHDLGQGDDRLPGLRRQLTPERVASQQARRRRILIDQQHRAAGFQRLPDPGGLRHDVPGMLRAVSRWIFSARQGTQERGDVDALNAAAFLRPHQRRVGDCRAVLTPIAWKMWIHAGGNGPQQRAAAGKWIPHNHGHTAWDTNPAHHPPVRQIEGDFQLRRRRQGHEAREDRAIGSALAGEHRPLGQKGHQAPCGQLQA